MFLLKFFTKKLFLLKFFTKKLFLLKFFTKKLKYFKQYKNIITVRVIIMSKPIFNWASVAKGTPQPIVQLETDSKEKTQCEQAERSRLAWEADAPMRAHQEAAVRARLEKDREQSLAREQWQEERDRKFSKEEGWLAGEWPTSHKVPHEPRLTVPRHVNERARDWVETALASWWPVWEQCETVEALRLAFINAFVPHAIVHGHHRGVCDFEHWEMIEGLTWTTHADRYANMLRWVGEMEEDPKRKRPYGNAFWIAVKNITFEHCLWAMNMESRAFRAMDKLCPNSEFQITGFLQVEGPVITWFADFTKYIPYKHDPKPKSKQALEAERQREEPREDDDYF